LLTSIVSSKAGAESRAESQAGAESESEAESLSENESKWGYVLLFLFLRLSASSLSKVASPSLSKVDSSSLSKVDSSSLSKVDSSSLSKVDSSSLSWMAYDAAISAKTASEIFIFLLFFLLMFEIFAVFIGSKYGIKWYNLDYN
jgi:hypothetical protein